MDQFAKKKSIKIIDILKQRNTYDKHEVKQYIIVIIIHPQIFRKGKLMRNI